MVVPRSTENIVTSSLKEELEALGVKAMPFVSLNMPSGKREVDLLFGHEGLYVCEATFTEKNALEAISKIQHDYLKYHRELGITGGFVLLYPEFLSLPVPPHVVKESLETLTFSVVIMFLPEDARRNFTVFEGTISQIARELSRYIRTPPTYVEPSVEWVIKSLREAATHIAAGLTHLEGRQLEDIFGGEHVLKNILQYEEKTYPWRELRMASAYLLVNQLLFYHVLSRKAGLPPIDTDTLTAPSQLQEYFNQVLDKNYRLVFSYNIVSRLSSEHTEMIKKVISVIESISPEKVGYDLLGTIFHDLIPIDVRKYVAAFYTNVHAADLLACLSIDRYDVHVSDFAVGSGGLLVAAYRRKKRLLELQGTLSELQGTPSEKVHEDFITQLLGVEVMPFAASVAACQIALQSPGCHPGTVNIAIWDSTDLHPSMKIPLLTDTTHVLHGRASPGEKDPAQRMVDTDQPDQIALTDYDVVIMNPPFTRQERVPKNYKDVLAHRFAENKEYLHGQLGYYGYFILLADRFLPEGGRLAFVLPAAFLRTRSSRGVITLLSQNYHVEYIVTGKRRLNFSESTWRREILLVARKTREKKDTIFAAIETIPKTQEECERLCRKIRNVRGLYEDHEVSAFTVGHEELERNLDWFRFITAFEIPELSKIWELLGTSTLLRRFGDLYNLGGMMKRGIESKGPQYMKIAEGIESRKGMKVQVAFVLKNARRAIRKRDSWILQTAEDPLVASHRYEGTTVNIPRDCVVPCVRTTSALRCMDISGDSDFVVVRDFPDADTFFSNGIFRGILPAWNRYVGERLGNLIILRRVVINAPGTFHLCYYSRTPLTAPGTTWICNLNDEDARILCLWFNSSINLAQIFNKRIEDVWLDIHKYILSDFSVLDPAQLSGEERSRLLTLFDTLSRKEVPPLAEQYPAVPEAKREVDTALLEVLGVKSGEVEGILQRLYEALHAEFSALEKMK